MEQAQVALQVIIHNAQDEAEALQRRELIQAIGRGIGSNAAHEIAHQFLGLCCSMDVKTSDDPNSAATYNNRDADGDPNPEVTNSDPAPYTGYGKDGTPIHWENSTQQALQKCLAQGYRSFQGVACAVKLNLSQNNTHPDRRERVWAKGPVPRQTGVPAHSMKLPLLPFLLNFLRGRL